MRTFYISLMDKLYLLCVTIAIMAVIVMTLLVAAGVFMRYVLGVGAVFSEPISIFLAIQLSFYGAAACYRANAHLRLEFFANMVPERWRHLPELLVHLLMAGISLFMVYYGINLVQATFFQSYPEFQYIRVGLVYTAIPIAGFFTFLFVLERMLFDSPSLPSEQLVGGS